jgi:hypothetical protein
MFLSPTTRNGSFHGTSNILRTHKYNPLLEKNRAPANLLLKKHMHVPCLEHREEKFYGERVADLIHKERKHYPQGVMRQTEQKKKVGTPGHAYKNNNKLGK